MIDGRHRFLRTDGDVMYYIQDSYLKKMKLGERYGELLRFREPSAWKIHGILDVMC